MQNIYLDHASTTPLLPEVVKEMTEVMTQHFGNPSSIHRHGRTARTLIEQSRRTIAKGLKASIGEIFFTSSATEAHNMILYAAVHDLGVKRIITTPIEHHCILHPLEQLQRQADIEVLHLDVDRYGHIDHDRLNTVLDENSAKTMVTLMHANNEIGTLLDIDRVSKICEQHGVLFHCDTVQTIGKIPLDLSKINLSFCAGSAHKFNGPKGVGFVYINNQNKIPALLHGGAQERNMRAGTENIYGIVGMAKAFEVALEQMEGRSLHIQQVHTHFVSRLKEELIDIEFNSPEEGLKNIVNVSFPPGEKADLLHLNLDINGISASSGSACSSGVEHDSHVLVAIGHPSERKAIRFSLSHLNTVEELDFVIQKLKTLTPSRP